MLLMLLGTSGGAGVVGAGVVGAGIVGADDGAAAFFCRIFFHALCQLYFT